LKINTQTRLDFQEALPLTLTFKTHKTTK